MNIDSKILVLGSTGMVGSAIVRKLQNDGYNNLLTPNEYKLDLTYPSSVKYYFKDNTPEYVFVASGLVGGIHANNEYPVEFFHANMMMAINILHYSMINNVTKLIYLGSSCIYPKQCEQPMVEDYLLNGHLESTNEMYALAKISGLKLCQSYNREYNTNFIGAIPCSQYGINDNLDLEKCHFIPAIMQRLHWAKANNLPTVEIWGTGEPLREFMYVDDLADSCIFLMQNYNISDIINIGVGNDYKISDISNMIKNIVGYEGELVYNTSKPDGTYQKLLNTTKLSNLGWKYKIKLIDGLKLMYDWYTQSLMESGV